MHAIYLSMDINTMEKLEIIIVSVAMKIMPFRMIRHASTAVFKLKIVIAIVPNNENKICVASDNESDNIILCRGSERRRSCQSTLIIKK